MPAQQVKAAAQEEGIGTWPLHRARLLVNVKSTRVGSPGGRGHATWYWHLTHFGFEWAECKKNTQNANS
jgi:hypothetical protein